jgi:hypothetical protein
MDLGPKTGSSRARIYIYSNSDFTFIFKTIFQYRVSGNVNISFSILMILYDDHLGFNLLTVSGQPGNIGSGCQGPRFRYLHILPASQ